MQIGKYSNTRKLEERETETYEKGNPGPRPQIYLELRINNKNHKIAGYIVQFTDQLFP